MKIKTLKHRNFAKNFAFVAITLDIMKCRSGESFSNNNKSLKKKKKGPWLKIKTIK